MWRTKRPRRRTSCRSPAAGTFIRSLELQTFFHANRPYLAPISLDDKIIDTWKFKTGWITISLILPSDFNERPIRRIEQRAETNSIFIPIIVRLRDEAEITCFRNTNVKKLGCQRMIVKRNHERLTIAYDPRGNLVYLGGKIAISYAFPFVCKYLNLAQNAEGSGLWKKERNDASKDKENTNHYDVLGSFFTLTFCEALFCRVVGMGLSSDYLFGC